MELYCLQLRPCTLFDDQSKIKICFNLVDIYEIILYLYLFNPQERIFLKVTTMTNDWYRTIAVITPIEMFFVMSITEVER